MQTLAPGQRIEARCTRCRDVTGHVIVALVDGQVAKVECCACGSVHKYYPARPAAVQAQSRPVRVESGRERTDAVREKSRSATSAAVSGSAPKAESRAKSSSARMQEELERQWREAIARNPATPVAYAMDRAFPLGSLVDHPVFGIGMVLAVTPPDKVDVLFREGMKALRCQC